MPPDPTKPDYDIRADVWSLGIALVYFFNSTFDRHPFALQKSAYEM